MLVLNRNSNGSHVFWTFFYLLPSQVKHTIPETSGHSELTQQSRVCSQTRLPVCIRASADFSVALRTLKPRSHPDEHKFCGHLWRVYLVSCDQLLLPRATSLALMAVQART